MILTRRTMFAGMAAAIAAPAIIRTPGLIMPIKPIVPLYGVSVMERAMRDFADIVAQMQNHILYGDDSPPSPLGFNGLIRT